MKIVYIHTIVIVVNLIIKTEHSLQMILVVLAMVLGSLQELSASGIAKTQINRVL